MRTVTALTPHDVIAAKQSIIPDVVLEVFNQLIAINFKGNAAQVEQNDVVDALVAKGFCRDQIFDNNWLDVEGIYRAQGWKVEYDKPGYNEFYNAYFIFSKK